MMGEIADMMLDGTLCQMCGEFLGDGDGDGIPSMCHSCAKENSKLPRAERGLAPHIAPDPNSNRTKKRATRRRCFECGQQMHRDKLSEHLESAHGKKPKSPPPGEPQ